MSIMDLIEKGKNILRKKHEKKTVKNPVLRVAVGLTVGAVAGVLLAPKSGKQTREDIVNTAKELPEKAKEVVEKIREKVEEGKEKLKATKTTNAEELTIKE